MQTTVIYHRADYDGLEALERMAQNRPTDDVADYLRGEVEKAKA